MTQSSGSIAQLPPQADLRKDVDAVKTMLADVQRGYLKNNLELTQLQGAVHELSKRFSEGGYVYIASPYSADSISVEEERIRQVMWYTVGLLRKRQWCYSPVLHCHQLAVSFDLPRDAANWMNYNFAMLAPARELHVLQLPGWEKSVGVTAEIAFWRQSKMQPVQFIEPDHVSNE